MSGRSPLPLRRAGEADADGRERGAGGAPRAAARPLRPLKRRVLPAAAGRGKNADAEAVDRAVASVLLPVRCVPPQAALEGGPLRRRPSRHQRSQCRPFLPTDLEQLSSYSMQYATGLIMLRCSSSRSRHHGGVVVRAVLLLAAVVLAGMLSARSAAAQQSAFSASSCASSGR